MVPIAHYSIVVVAGCGGRGAVGAMLARVFFALLAPRWPPNDGRQAKSIELYIYIYIYICTLRCVCAPKSRPAE